MSAATTRRAEIGAGDESARPVVRAVAEYMESQAKAIADDLDKALNDVPWDNERGSIALQDTRWKIVELKALSDQLEGPLGYRL